MPTAEFSDTVGKILGFAATAALLTLLVRNPDDVVRFLRASTQAGTDILMAVQGR